MSTRINAFLLAASTALGGCTTAHIIRQDVGDLLGKAAKVVTPTQPNASSNQPQAAQRRATAMPVGSPITHPAVQEFINDITTRRNQTPFDTARCSDSLLAGRGPSSAVTNPHAVGSVQGRGDQIIRQGTRRILGNGTLGQIMTPGVEGTLDTASASSRQLTTICGNIGSVSERFKQADRMPAASRESQFDTGYNTLASIMTRAANAGLISGENTGAGSNAMIKRGWDQSQTTGAEKLLNRIYTPKGNGAVWDFVK